MSCVSSAEWYKNMRLYNITLPTEELTEDVKNFKMDQISNSVEVQW